MSVFEDDNYPVPPGGSATDRALPDQPRVLIVDDALASQMVAPLHRLKPDVAMTTVPSFLFAMGEAACWLPDVVMVPAEQLVGTGESATRCLRDLLPEARLVVVANEGATDEVNAALRGGFDMRLDMPVDDAVLCAVFEDGDDNNSSHENDGARHVDVAEMAGEPTPQAADKPGHSEAAEQQTSPPSPDAEPRSGLPNEQDEPLEKQYAPVNYTPALGDVDLIETLLSAGDQLAETAVQLIRQRSGIQQIHWSASRDDVPDAHMQAAVRYRGRTFGMLHAPVPTPHDTLAGWAAWLSRWLTLHDHVSQLEELSMHDELTGARIGATSIAF